MKSMATDGIVLAPANAKLLRVLLTYILPALAVFYVVLSGLWLQPDSFAGMYGNLDGQWLSWNTRGILEWSSFLDFSPFSPLIGTGSLFAPFLPWLNPGALALAIPAQLPLQHLASMLIYLAELSASLYLLYRHLEFSREHSFVATLLHLCIFFIPFNGLTLALPWYALAPVNAHLIAAMNVATIALMRVGYEGLFSKLLFGFFFFAALFSAFASAPVLAMTYVPAYGILWSAFLIPFQAQYAPVVWRGGTIALALLLFGLIGAPFYLVVTALTSARGDFPPIFHPGWQLLSSSYWQGLVSEFPFCLQLWQLMCPWPSRAQGSLVGLFDSAALGGAIILLMVGTGVKKRYGLVIVALLALFHFYALLMVEKVLGRLHVVSPPYLMWAFFPLAPPAAIVAGSTVAGWLVGRRAAGSPWMPAIASCLLASVAVFVWVQLIMPYQPRLPGEGPLGLAPIAHVPINKGPIVDYLQQHIGLQPGAEFRGYASTILGVPEGLVRKSSNVPNGRMTYEAYVGTRQILVDRFGNSFQNVDLWNSDIPTLEEYGQWISKQLFFFYRDLLTEPQDEVDPKQSMIFVYRFRPALLRALGVRFVIADGTLVDSSRIMTEAGSDGATMGLYELKGANLGQFSPTQLMWAANYGAAVKMLRQQGDLERRVVLLGDPEPQPRLVPASRAQLTAIRDGYHLSAAAPGTAMLLLPIQFSHCWRIEEGNNDGSLHIFRANILQTGILFTGTVDVKLRFNFEPWKTSCRFEDARDLSRFDFK
jgi:hypothetical protein